ncbi:stage V sporulation protein AD, partial [Casaltella massiliensis]|nr:stage V sporulation protein AD [Casaltella massiliensis]
MVQTVVENAIKNGNKSVDDIDYMIAGDLLNQLLSTSFAAREVNIPFLEVYGACSTMALSLSLGSMLVDGG